MKTCRNCRAEKPTVEFVDGLGKERLWCRPCRDKHNQRAKKWQRENPEKARALRLRNYQRNAEKRRAYSKQHSQALRDSDPEEARRRKNRTVARKRGIPECLLDNLETKREGPCCVCGSKPDEQKNAHSLDHDHTTGAFRGILCSRCNTALGLLKEDPQRCMALVGYIQSPPGLEWLKSD